MIEFKQVSKYFGTVRALDNFQRLAQEGHRFVQPNERKINLFKMIPG